MCKSPLELVLVYKLLSFLDPNWIPSQYGVFCLACFATYKSSKILICFALNSTVGSFTNICRGNMILINSETFHIHMCIHFRAYLIHKSLNVSNKSCWGEQTLHPTHVCQTWGWSSQGTWSISFVLHVYLNTRVPRLHKSVMCVREATSFWIWKCLYMYNATSIWIWRQRWRFILPG
jgi:hypothetical protein